MSMPMPCQDVQTASLRSGTALLSARGDWQVASAGLHALLGEPDGALLGEPAHRRLFPDAAARIDAALRAFENGAGTPLALDVERILPGGRTQRLAVDIDRLPGAAGQAPQLLLQLHDATEGDRARRALQALQAQQEQVAYGISHDLRASLRGIDGFASQLSRQPLDAQGLEHLERVRAAARHANSLVEALVQLSRAGSLPVASAPVDLGLLAAWVLAELQDADPARSVAIKIAPELHARGDERQLKRLLEQLLHNAWKFSAGNPEARIAVEAVPAPPGRCIVCIRDNGSGFDMRYVDKLFVPFRRLHGADDGGGHGLGLAIVQAIAQQHDGRAWAESEPGAGSRFYVELPADDAGSTP
jgi:signal transduction histidine kinase